MHKVYILIYTSTSVQAYLAFDCVATIRGRQLFEGGMHLKKYSIDFHQNPPGNILTVCWTLSVNDVQYLAV